MTQADLTALSSSEAKAAASQRWDAIDVARGIAIVAMIVYHFSWDLSFLQLIATNILQVPAWRWFARGIAGSFLILAGFGLTLAHAQGFRRVPFLRRLMKVGGAALAVTVVTYFAFPESYIFFGILHCIAVSSVLALPFLRLHPALTLAAAVFCLVAPWIFTNPALDAPWLDWLGLGASDPVTNDYVPIFPWFGLVLIGVAAGKLLLPRRETIRPRPLARGGCALPGIGLGRAQEPADLPDSPDRPARHSLWRRTDCRTEPVGRLPSRICLAQNGNPALCPSVCSCIVQQVPERDLWQRLIAGTGAAEDNTRISRAAQQCMRQNPPS